MCVFLFYKLYKDAHKSYLLEQEKVIIQQEKLENLKSKIAPHFLFNNLNKIRNELLFNDPKDAADKIVAMSDLLRSILNKRGLLFPLPKKLNL